MTDEGTPIGPGFFIFFQYESGGIGKKKVEFSDILEPDDKEVLELVKIIFTFLQGQHER